MKVHSKLNIHVRLNDIFNIATQCEEKSQRAIGVRQFEHVNKKEDRFKNVMENNALHASEFIRYA